MLKEILDKVLKWLFGIFLNPQENEIQKLIWSIIASVVVVFIVDFLRKPRLKFFNKNLIIADHRWRNSKLWKLKILLKKSLISYSVNNLKVFYCIYDNKRIQKVKLQAGSDYNPLSELKMQDSDYDNKGLNFARGESNNFHLILRTNEKQFYRGRGRTDTPPDFWYLPCDDSLTRPKYEENIDEPSDDNKFMLDDGLFFVKIEISSDQLVSKCLFKLILENENLSLIKLNLIGRIKFHFFCLYHNVSNKISSKSRS